MSVLLQAHHMTAPADVITQQSLDARIEELLTSICAMQQRDGWVAAKWRWVVIGAVVRKTPAAVRDKNESSSQPANCPPLVAIGSSHAKGPGPASQTDLPRGEPVVHTQGTSVLPVSANGEPQRSPGTNQEQCSASDAAGSDPSLVVPVIASQEDVLRARQLRDQIRKEYLDRPGRACSPWCVGAD